MFLTNLLLILHLAAVFALVGGVALRWFGARSLTVAAVPEEVVWATRQVAGNGAMLTRAGGAGALITGLALAGHLGTSLGSGWLSASFMVWILLLGIGDGFTTRTMRKLAATVDEGDGTPDAVRVGALRMATTVELLLVAVLLVLMVWRPGA